MADGGWRRADGGWRMADGGWRTVDGGRQKADGGRRSHQALSLAVHMAHLRPFRRGGANVAQQQQGRRPTAGSVNDLGATDDEDDVDNNDRVPALLPLPRPSCHCCCGQAAVAAWAWQRQESGEEQRSSRVEGLWVWWWVCTFCVCSSHLCAYVGSWYWRFCVCSFLVCGTVSALSRQKIQCQQSFCVGTDTHVG